MIIKKIFLITIITTSIVMTTYANKHCIDNSWHMKKKYDCKDYHPVDCTCPCGSDPAHMILSDRGKCLKCGHYRKNPWPLYAAIATSNINGKPVIDVKKLKNYKKVKEG